MLPVHQERALDALQKQLDCFSKAGLLTQDQKRDFAKLSRLHKVSAEMPPKVVPKLENDFEQEAPYAFPAHRRTPADLKIISFHECRTQLGCLPTFMQPATNNNSNANANSNSSPNAIPPFGSLEKPSSSSSSSSSPAKSSKTGFGNNNSNNNDNLQNNDSVSSWDAMSSFAGSLAGESQDYSSENNKKQQQHNNLPMPGILSVVKPPTEASAITDFIDQHLDGRCYQCNKKIERTRLGFGPYKARWCHEANSFCCEGCVSGRCRAVLPSYAILKWDFEPKVVRDAFGMDSEMDYQKPSLIPGAENPQLFDQLPALQDLRKTRYQLSKLHEIGSVCKKFMSALTTEPKKPQLRTAGSPMKGSNSPSNSSNDAQLQQQLQQYQQQQNNNNSSLLSDGNNTNTNVSAAAASGGTTGGGGGGAGVTFFVSERQRYLVMESEIWSLCDLEQAAKSISATMKAPTTNVSQKFHQKQQIPQFSAFLQSIRDSMIRHVLSECEDCKLRAAHECLECKAERPIYSFDVRNVHECVRCSAVFHRACWDSIQKTGGDCPGCMGITLDAMRK